MPTPTGGDSCFLPGTLVQSGTGAKKIEDIKVGDRVASFEGDKVTESAVSQIFKRERDHYFVLSAGDYRVKATAEHPFYTGDGKFKEVSKLKAGDRVFAQYNLRVGNPTDASNKS